VTKRKNHKQLKKCFSRKLESVGLVKDFFIMGVVGMVGFASELSVKAGVLHNFINL
jgi:hypothetical protein